MDEREFTEFLGHFVQGLTYKVPPQPGDKSILGFWPPLICLKEKAGDCDSKSTLFATLYYHYRKRGTAMLIVPHHALVGIKNRHKIFPTDTVITIGGEDYVLLESTSYNPPGRVLLRYYINLKNHQFLYIPMY